MPVKRFIYDPVTEAYACCVLCEYALTEAVSTVLQLCAGQRGNNWNACVERTAEAWFTGLGFSGQVALGVSCGTCAVKVHDLCVGKNWPTCRNVAIVVILLSLGK